LRAVDLPAESSRPSAYGGHPQLVGLVNAYPAESVELFKLAQAGKREEVFALYRWFPPLLRMDTVPKFVQLIKWVQEQAGVGSARVRAPRMEIVGKELEIAKATFKTALNNRSKTIEKQFSSFKGA
jgi:dihydrodipicolinate synthase/N-acetylneuraminate lyase